jgi:C4-type Zn-finger protein
MEDSHLGRLEQQISSLMTMIEGFIKKTEEHMKMMEKKNENDGEKYRQPSLKEGV